MRIFITLFIIFLYKTSSGETRHFSQDSHSGNYESLQEVGGQEYRILREFTHSNASVWLIVREAGHMVGQPFQVELRVQCNSSSDGTSKVDIMGLPVKDSFSVCDLDPKSVLINLNQTGIALKTKSVDISDYNNQIASGTVDIEPKCAEATTIRQFSLENLCQTDR